MGSQYLPCGALESELECGPYLKISESRPDTSSLADTEWKECIWRWVKVTPAAGTEFVRVGEDIWVSMFQQGGYENDRTTRDDGRIDYLNVASDPPG